VPIKQFVKQLKADTSVKYVLSFQHSREFSALTKAVYWEMRGLNYNY